MSREVFEIFVRQCEPSLRRALVATYGPDRGRDATAEALGYAWEHWEAVGAMANPIGYLYRVGQSRTRRRRWPVFFPEPPSEVAYWVEPGLPKALASLTSQQRICVVLIDGYDWTLREVADLVGLATTSVQNHLERARHKLRVQLKASEDA